MTPDVSVIVPAYNEAHRLGETLQSLNGLKEINEIVVVDDGSRDDTASVGEKWADTVIRWEKNCGKGYALDLGWRKAKGEFIVFLDADLGRTADLAAYLIEPVMRGQCDMTIATLPPAEQKGGFGFVKGLADQGVRRLTGQHISAPLSGQRAMRRHLLEQIPPLSRDFGIEVSLTVEALRRGFRISEVPLAFSHRETGRNLAGFVHRGRQFVHISRTLYRLWRAT